MSLWTLVQGILLLSNGLDILNNERFLEKHGWGFTQLGAGTTLTGAPPNPLKHQIIGGLHAAAYLRVPLIAMNAIVILVKLLFG